MITAQEAFAKSSVSFEAKIYRRIKDASDCGQFYYDAIGEKISRSFGIELVDAGFELVEISIGKTGKTFTRISWSKVVTHS